MHRIKHLARDASSVSVNDQKLARHDTENPAESSNCLISVELPALVVSAPTDVDSNSGYDAAGSSEVPVYGNSDTVASEHEEQTAPGSNLLLSYVARRTWSVAWSSVFAHFLLISSPLGIVLHFLHVNSIAIFTINLIAISPLSATIVSELEEVVLHVGDIPGAIISALLGNAVELIISTTAVFQNRYYLVQMILLGSLLSRLLLALGLSFFLGGLNTTEQTFDANFAQNASSLLFLAVISLVTPTAFEAWAKTGTNNDIAGSGEPPVAGVPELSRATAILLLTIRVSQLIFQLKTHSTSHADPNSNRYMRNIQEPTLKPSLRPRFSKLKNWRSSRISYNSQRPRNDVAGGRSAYTNLLVSTALLVVLSVLAVLNARFLIESLYEAVCNGMPMTFVGLVLVPVFCNAMEHINVILLAIYDNIDVSISLAIGASLQTVLLVLPSVVVIAWVAGKDGMTLYFDGFQLITLFVTVLLLNYLVRDGGVNWLQGYILIILYVIVAVATWFYPSAPEIASCSS